MFIWPLFYRLAVAPVTQPELQWPELSTHLTTTEFWNTFPPAHIAIPFLFIGYLIMAFLGGLVEGKLNTAIVQFSIPLVIIVASIFIEWRKKQNESSS